MKRLILHAGQHKTGTSSIQRYLFGADSPQFHYLNPGQPNSSKWLLKAFKHDLEKLPAYRQFRDKPGLREHHRTRALSELGEAIQASDKPVDVMSAESISLFRPPELAELNAFFREHYDRVDVHIYFRPLKSRLESGFQEKLKHRHVELTETHVLDYRRKLIILDRQFGHRKVHPHRYHRQDFPQGSVVVDFLQRVGFDVPDALPVETNSSLSLEAAKLLYLYRCRWQRRQPGDDKRIARLSELPGPAFRFHSELFTEVVTQREGSMAWFEERAGFRIAEDLAAADEVAVRCEEDLYRIAESAREWLAAQTGTNCFESDPGDLAELVHALA